MRTRFQNTKWTRWHAVGREIFSFHFANYMLNAHISFDDACIVYDLANEAFDVIFSWNIEPLVRLVNKPNWTMKIEDEREENTEKAPNLENYRKFARTTVNVIGMKCWWKLQLKGYSICTHILNTPTRIPQHTHTMTTMYTKWK